MQASHADLSQGKSPFVAHAHARRSCTSRLRRGSTSQSHAGELLTSAGVILGRTEKDSDRPACFSREEAVEKFIGAHSDETPRDISPSIAEVAGNANQMPREMAVVTST
ncbi:MAG: hypothetical protein ACYDEP_05420 [Acidimicrobiales bacterium]